MISSLASLISSRQADPAHCAISAPAGRATWGQLADWSAAASAELANFGRQRIGVVHRGDAASWSALAALEGLAADVFLLDAATPPDELRRLADELRLAGVVAPESSAGIPGWKIDRLAPSAGDGAASVTILTSGTTGRPKAVRHTWATLCRPVRASLAREPLPWLLTYRPHLYAGLQVALQCFASGGTLVTPGENTAPSEVAELMAREQVACVSATPSYWRQLLILSAPAALAKIGLQQITLGGEPVDQQILDMLKTAFPAARIAHIYATTELGRCFSVTDGRAGFPARFLNAVSADGVGLRIENGELQVRSANAMRGYDAAGEQVATAGQWFATGDLVRQAGDRCYFVGRRSDIINVGGNKVSPQEVEQVLRAVPGVADVRVYAKPSSLVGQLVAAQIVPLCAQDAEAVRAAVVDASLRQLPPAQRPRAIEIVSQIELSQAGKMPRSR